jgi:hypothetical protein
MNQEKRILKYIDDFGSITPLEAMADLGVMRLASRISDLKRRGIKIVSEWEKGTNRYGEKTKYKRYRRMEDE